MYFCPKCSYLLDIKKSTNINNDNDEDEEKLILEKPSDAFKKIKSLNKFRPNFSRDEMINDKKYSKLKKSDKEKLEKLFNTVYTDASFYCNNCNYSKQLDKTFLLYKFEKTNNIDNNKTIEDNKILAESPILPRTKDYMCKNPSCKTLKDPSLKEAIYYRDENSFTLNYLCTVCNYNWKI